MKRCPECRKDYLDDSLMYCLDDGAQLVTGRVTDEPETAILSGEAISEESATRTRKSDETIDQNLKVAVIPSRYLSRERVLWFTIAALGLIATVLTAELMIRPARSAAVAPLRRFAISIP